MHLVPKVVIDLPFEGRKVEGSWKYRSRERVPKEGSRREETITEAINSCTGDFHTMACVRTKGRLEPTLQTSQFHYILIRMKKVCWQLLLIGVNCQMIFIIYTCFVEILKSCLVYFKGKFFMWEWRSLLDDRKHLNWTTRGWYLLLSVSHDQGTDQN